MGFNSSLGFYSIFDRHFYLRMGCAGSSAVDKQLSLGRGESRERDYRSPNDDEPRKIEKIDNENITSCLAGLYQVGDAMRGQVSFHH
jgi:hypothetical protein